jgi:hypothetical protein
VRSRKIQRTYSGAHKSNVESASGQLHLVKTCPIRLNKLIVVQHKKLKLERRNELKSVQPIKLIEGIHHGLSSGKTCAIS